MSNLAKIKRTIKPRSAKRLLSTLFGSKKTVNVHKVYPERYYRNIYFTKQLYDGVELVAKIERLSISLANNQTSR